MYDGNKWFRLMTIYVGSFLFVTACSKYSRNPMLSHSYDPTRNQVPLNARVDNLDYEQIKNGNISQSDLSAVPWPKVNCAEIDFLKVHDQKTLLCKVIEANLLNLFEKILEHIKCNPIKYPPEKVLYLIAGYGVKPRGMHMKMPLLMRAVIKGHSDSPHIALHMLKLLFTTLRHYGLDVCEKVFYLRFGSEHYTIIHEAVESVRFEIIAYLIEFFIQTKKAQGQTNASISDSLLDILNVENSARATPLELAFQAYAFLGTPSSLKILQYLVEHLHSFAQITSQSIFALRDLAERGDGERLKNTLNVIRERLKKINKLAYKEMMARIVNLPDKHGRTLLYYTVICEAAQSSRKDTSEYLMELGASCTCFDKNGISPLFIAIAFGALDIVNLLLDKKFAGNLSLQSDINRQGYAGLTPLNFAVWCREKVVISVISKLFDTYIKYYNQGVHYKPLNNAALIGKVDGNVVNALLNAGASFSVPNNVGEVPLGKVIKNKNFQILELLLNAGADPVAAHFDDFLEYISAKPFSASDQVNTIWMLTLMVQRAIMSTDQMDIHMALQLAYKNAASEGQRQRESLQYSLAFVLKNHGIPTKITTEYNSKKRPFDADECPVVHTKRKRKSIQACDGSSGRSHAT